MVSLMESTYRTLWYFGERLFVRPKVQSSPWFSNQVRLARLERRVGRGAFLFLVVALTACALGKARETARTDCGVSSGKSRGWGQVRLLSIFPTSL